VTHPSVVWNSEWEVLSVDLIKITEDMIVIPGVACRAESPSWCFNPMMGVSWRLT